ncbi:hypothetical protein D3C85_1034120 [compost metagenome]
MQYGQWFSVVAVDFQVVLVDLIGGPETEYGAGLDEFFIDELGQHRLGIAEQ